MLRPFVRAAERARPTGDVVVYYSWPDFARKANALVYELNAAGIPAVIENGTGFLSRARVRLSGRLHIGFWNHFYPEYLPEQYIFYNAEPLRFSRWGNNAEWRLLMSRATQVWGYSPFDEEYVRSLNLPFRYVPFGYSSFYEDSFRSNIGGDAIVEDIDVLFFGHITPRRQQILDAVRATGLTVVTVTYERPLRGAALDRMIARSRIVLSMFAVDDEGAQGPDLARLDHLLSNGRFVLHERPPAASSDPDFEANVPTCAREDIAGTCERFARDAGARERAALQSYQWFKSMRPLSAYIPFDEVRRLTGLQPVLNGELSGNS